MPSEMHILSVYTPETNSYQPRGVFHDKEHCIETAKTLIEEEFDVTQVRITSVPINDVGNPVNIGSSTIQLVNNVG